MALVSSTVGYPYASVAGLPLAGSVVNPLGYGYGVNSLYGGYGAYGGLYGGLYNRAGYGYAGYPYGYNGLYGGAYNGLYNGLYNGVYNPYNRFGYGYGAPLVNSVAYPYL